MTRWWNLVGHPDSNGDRHSDADTDGDGDSDANGDGHCHRDANADADGNANTDTHGDGHRDTDPYADADREPDADRDPDPGRMMPTSGASVAPAKTNGTRRPPPSHVCPRRAICSRASGCFRRTVFRRAARVAE